MVHERLVRYAVIIATSVSVAGTATRLFANVAVTAVLAASFLALASFSASRIGGSNLPAWAGVTADVPVSEGVTLVSG
jgi:hypothetical protein